MGEEICTVVTADVGRLAPNPGFYQQIFALSSLDPIHCFAFHLFCWGAWSCNTISVHAKCLVFPPNPGYAPSQNHNQIKKKTNHYVDEM